MNFVGWYLDVLVPEMTRFNVNFFVFVSHFFSFRRLGSSLMAPWKHEVSVVRGFDIGTILNRLSFNVISRMIGFVVRVLTILLGLIVMVVGGVVVVFVSGMVLVFPFLALPRFLADKSMAERYGPGLSLVQILRGFSKSDFFRFLTHRCGLQKSVLLDELGRYSGKIKELENGFTLRNWGPGFQDESVFMSLYGGDQQIRKFFSKNGFEKSDISRLVYWYQSIERQAATNNLMDKKYILSIPAIGKGWSSGYTPSLDKFSRDLSKEDWRFFPFVGRDEEMNKLVDELSRDHEPAILLYGLPGVGRHSLIYGLAKKIQLHELTGFVHWRVVLVQPEKLLAASEQRTAGEMLLSILNEAAAADNVVVVVDNLHELLADDEKGGFGVGEVLETLNSMTRLPLVGLTGSDDFNKVLSQKKSLLKDLRVLEVKEMNVEDSLKVLFGRISGIESRERVYFRYKALRAVVELANQYMKNDVFPEKAVDLVSELLVYSKHNNIKVVDEKNVLALVSKITEIPMTTSGVQREELLNLETALGKKVFEQERSLGEVAKALRRNRTKVGSSEKPIGTFLFLGPTGVGKTATAKALSEVYFGKQRFQRLDMAEFQSGEGVTRLIGSKAGGEPGLLAEKISSNPYGLLLLDEFEKAPREVHNLFLTIFDEGYFTSALGSKVDCTNLIIIATSNAGSEEIRQYLSNGKADRDFEKHMIEYLLKGNYFAPEMLNRFDAVVFYKPLSDQGLAAIAEAMLEELRKRLKKERNVVITYTPETIEQIVAKGYDESFGARSIQHYVQTTIGDDLAKKMLVDPGLRRIKI